jgi:soluble lytic murein transglycosylase
MKISDVSITLALYRFFAATRSHLLVALLVIILTPFAQGAGHIKRAMLVGGGADADFIMLRDASARGDMGESGRLAARLTDYPIQSYVEYYRLYPRLVSTPEGEIRNYLNRYDGTAIADRLRNDWLLILGRARDWRLFDEQYPLFVLNDDLQVKCYALSSRIAKGENVVKAARELLVQPKGYGEACVDLIHRLYQDKQFSDADMWRQIRLAAEYGASTIARRIAYFIDVSERQILPAIEKPSAVLERGAAGSQAVRELFIIALGRVAKDNLDKAERALHKSLFRLSHEEQSQVWAQLALPASIALSKDAVNFWRKTWDATLSPDGYQWRARAALRDGDWGMVARAIDSMPRELQKDAAWIYWRGRAHLAQNHTDDAQKLFLTIASQHTFYGLLAAEELGQKLIVPPRPQVPTSEEMSEAMANNGFRNSLKFLDLELRFEGNREWNWQLRKLSERQLLAAGEFARQSGVLDRMVTTADRAKVELDFTQRYPSPHDDIMQTAIQPLGLDKAWVYGLIRQESRFVKAARSSVGASGLMQIMPATANYVARKIGMAGFSLSNLNDTRTNITLGTQYLNMVLNSLGGSQTLATAAYNAGPSRPRLWRATLDKSIEGAIFAETIPFSETRGYVKNVLANATCYSAMFDTKSPSLKSRLGIVSPRDAMLNEITDLP